MLPGSQTPPAISVSFRAAPGWSKRYSVPLINLIQPLAELWFSAALTTPKPAASCLGSPQQLRLCLDWRELFACVGRGEEQVPRAGGAVGVSVLNVCRQTQQPGGCSHWERVGKSGQGSDAWPVFTS